MRKHIHSIFITFCLILISAFTSLAQIYPDGIWGQVAKITASDEADFNFGYSVSISGDTVVVGTLTNPGSAYIFERDQGGVNNWGEVAKITASDEADFNFGYSVSISGDTVVVGARGDAVISSNYGSAYIFERDQGGVNNWGEVAKITASDEVDFNFGYSVSISGDTVVVGALANPGSAYIFRIADTSNLKKAMPWIPLLLLDD